MFVYSHPDPIAISLGPLHVRWYGLMYLLGFLAGWWLARRRAARPGSTWTQIEVDDLIFYCAIGVIAGGRLGWMLFYGTERILADPFSVFRIWEGGMSFHGGLLGVVLALAFFANRRAKHLGDVFDFASPLPAIGIGPPGVSATSSTASCGAGGRSGAAVGNGRSACRYGVAAATRRSSTRRGLEGVRAVRDHAGGTRRGRADRCWRASGVCSRPVTAVFRCAAEYRARRRTREFAATRCSDCGQRWGSGCPCR